MIKRNLWRPETCGCKFEYEWDDSVPSDSRVHTLISAKKCNDHSHLIDDQAYDQVLNHENRFKNQVIADINEHVKKAQGIDIEIGFAFDDKRKLVVFVPSEHLTLAKQREAILNSRFNGRVEIV